MRVPIGQYLLTVLALSAGLSNANPLVQNPKIKFEYRSANGTDGYFTDQEIKDGVAGDAALRKIDWKLVKGGLKWSYKPLMLLATCAGASFQIMSYIKQRSNENSCAPLWGNKFSDDGTQGINYYYYVTTDGENCDTTAQSKTIADAIEDAWEEINNNVYDHACIDLSHGGTWHGHLAIATSTSGVDVETFCQDKN